MDAHAIRELERQRDMLLEERQMWRRAHMTLTEAEREAIRMARGIMLVEHDLSLADEGNGKQPRRSSGYWRGMSSALGSLLERAK